MENQFMNLEETAKWIRLPKVTICNLAENGKIPGQKIDGEWRFSKEELLNYFRCDAETMRMVEQDKKRREEEAERGFRKMQILNLRSGFHGQVRYSLVKNLKGRSWESVVGYGVDALRRRLKSTIPDGYTWEDFLEGRLHIDHIIPGCAFNIEDIHSIDFRRSWDLKNLQLLPVEEHRKKGSKLFQSFQPELNLKEVSHERDHGSIS